MRKDPKGNQLLPRMHYKSGRYYYVRRNKWYPLARNYSDALRQYADMETPRTGWSDLVALTYEGYEKRHKQGKMADSTWNQYKGVKHKIIYGLSLFAPHEITTSTVTQFIHQYEDTPNMANRMLSVLRAVFEAGCRTGACDTNPAANVKRLKEGVRDRYLTDTEYARIWDNANPQTRLIMDMCYMTAQRISDVLKIEHGDIKPDGLEVEQKKTGVPLKFPMTPEMEAVIREAKGLHKVMCKYLFHPKGKTTPYSYRAIRDSFNRAADKAKVSDVGLHDIRAKSLTDAKRDGIDAQKLAGHTNPAMTARYIRRREVDVVSGPSLTGLRKSIEG